jgi:hypothetical protein
MNCLASTPLKRCSACTARRKSPLSWRYANDRSSIRAAAVRPAPLRVHVAEGVAISTLRATGLAPGFFALWISEWLAAWLFAFPAVLVVTPLARRAVERLVKQE